MRLIDADALDEAIVKESEGYQGSVYSCGISDGLMLSRQCIEDAPTINAQSSVIEKWIPVTERLPGSQGPFLTRYGFGDASIETGQFFYGVLYYLYADAEPHWQHASVGVEVTHWMPLPAPPAVDTNKQP